MPLYAVSFEEDAADADATICRGMPYALRDERWRLAAGIERLRAEARRASDVIVMRCCCR